MKASRIVPAIVALTASLPEVLWAQGGGGEGGLFDINTGLSTWTLLVFAGLVFLLGKYAWGPILAAVEAREKGIQAALDEAAKRNEEAAGMLAEHKEQLADARRQASEIIAEGKAAGDRVRKDIEEKARAEGQAIIERARTEIERERDAALETLRSEAVDLALAAASHLIRESLDQNKDRQLVERYLDDMSGSGGARA
ncbi:MAG: F0F1 ATP synthase subunit B [Gemmatimonadetes bacterium]|nr:F0F1 ATP synthase subunit B [Gemmatimonadota bacterium]MDA1103728.1 F0F1 ATP synthase subunit B [Gemmatimonadota bacterium]